jgi:outer membrane protein TolC
MRIVARTASACIVKLWLPVCFMAVALVGGGVSSLPVFADDVTAEPTVYSLEDCIRVGLLQSGVARNAQRDQDIANAQMGQAYGLAFPHLSLTSTYTRLDELQELDLGGGSQTLGNLDNSDVTATVEQLLYAGGQVGAARRAAKAARAYADAARTATELQLIYDIERRFFGVLLAREIVAVQSASVDQLQAYVDQVEQRAEGGATSEFDLLRARVRLANEVPKLIAARNACELDTAAFASVINIPADGVFTGQLACADIDLSYDEMLRRALENRAVLRGSELRVQLGREAIVNARSEGRPDLRARLNYNGANSYQFVSFEEDWQWHWNASIVLSWNIWDGALTRNTVKQKESEYKKLITDNDELLKAVRLEVRQAYLALEHARQSTAASRDNVALAERALAIAQTQHESGLTTYLEFTDANLALSTARLTRFQALHDRAVAVSAIRYACGGIVSPEGLGASTDDGVKEF